MEENQITIPDGWHVNIINELCNIGRGRVISQSEIINNVGTFPVYSSQSQNNGEMGRIDTYDFDGDYVTWTTDGAYAGTIFFRTGKFNCTNVCGTLKSKNEDELDLRFLSYLLSTVAKRHVSYVGNPKLMNGVMAKIALCLPKSKTEQQSIATILSKTDEAIAQTEALIAKYTRIKTGLMQDLLTKGIDENGNIRSEATHEFKDSPLGRIPKEWDCDKLISFCTKIQDGTHFSPKTDENGMYKYLTSKNIRMGYLDLRNLEFINEEAHNKIYKRCSVELGDVLLTKDGASTGNICLNDLNEEFSLLSSVALIRGKKGILKNEFIFQFFMEESGQKSLIGQMSGNAIPRITLTKINNTLIKIPPFKEQELIVQKLKPQDKLINEENIKLSKLKSIKAGLMQDLLSGRVRVKGI